MEDETYLYPVNTKSIRPVIVMPDGSKMLSNLDSPRRPVNFLYIITLVIITLLAGCFTFAGAGRYDRVFITPQIICLVIVLLAWFLNKLRGKPPRNWLSPDVVFVSSFSVFHFGYILFYAFGLKKYFGLLQKS